MQYVSELFWWSAMDNNLKSRLYSRTKFKSLEQTLWSPIQANQSIPKQEVMNFLGSKKQIKATKSPKKSVEKPRSKKKDKISPNPHKKKLPVIIETLERVKKGI